jgi:hypothetical protein
VLLDLLQGVAGVLQEVLQPKIMQHLLQHLESVL